MTETGMLNIYANTIALILCGGLSVLVRRFRMADLREKKTFLWLIYTIIMMALFYVLCVLRDEKVIPCNKAGAMAIETLFELTINMFAVEWFVYMDYKIFRSRDRIRRIAPLFTVPFVILCLMVLVNAFTGFMLSFDEDLVLTEHSVYVIADLFRVAYFVASVVVLAVYRKYNERMKFFRALPFFVPMFIYILIYYFTPFATPALGLAMGITLLFVEMVNEQCYQDNETGFYNNLYLDHLRREISKGKYNLESAIVFRLPSDKMEEASAGIQKQMPQSVDTIRYGENSIITLARVNDRSSLHMLSEDVTDALAALNIEVDVNYDLKKKKENGSEFLERFLEKA